METTSVSETPLTPLGRAGQALKRLVFGASLDVSAIAVERMRKLVALPVLSPDALSSVAYGPQAMLAVLVLAGLPGLSYWMPAGAAIVFLMLPSSPCHPWLRQGMSLKHRPATAVVPAQSADGPVLARRQERTTSGRRAVAPAKQARPRY